MELSMFSFQEDIIEELRVNNNKISPTFITNIVEKSTVKYFQLTPMMRVCVITLPTGHEVLGKAQVLDPNNDVELIGNQIAYKKAIEEIWGLVGAIAKLHV